MRDLEQIMAERNIYKEALSNLPCMCHELIATAICIKCEALDEIKQLRDSARHTEEG